jgi:pimeloyl-ACP methyl ester carboxylesterase
MAHPILHSNIEGEGKPILILHGFLGMSDNWKSVSLALAKKGFEVHALDLRNHGRSFHSEEFTYEAMANDVLDYCKAHHLSKVDVIGHSMGGKTAMLFACQNPDLVNKLIIADIGPKYYPPHHQDILNGLNAVDFSKNPERSDVDNTLKEYIKIPSVRQFLTRSLYWKTPEQLAFRFNVAVFMKSYEEIGKALSKDLIYEKSTLFIRGGVSNYVLDEDVPEIKNHFPNAVLETMPKVGHWLHAENPTLFLELVLGFIGAQD